MCTEYNERFHNLFVKSFEGKKCVTAYKAYWMEDYEEGRLILPVFGAKHNGLALYNQGELKGERWDYAANNRVPFDGWQDSPRDNTTLTDDEKKINVLSDEVIQGLHAFLYPRDAIIWAWHNAGMAGISIGVVPVKLYREHLVCAGIGGYDIREYDTCENGPAVVARKLKVSATALRKPLWFFDKDSLGKKPLLSALAAAKKVKEKPREMSRLGWRNDLVTA
jgi:hypothetical protein